MTSERERDIARARERADLARLRFSNAVDDVLHRLKPDHLRKEAVEVVTDQLDQARRDLMARFRHWPVTMTASIIAVVAVLGALIFWRPARVAASYVLRLGSLALTVRNLWSIKNEQNRSAV